MLGVGRFGPLGRSLGEAAGGPSASELERNAWLVLAGVEGVGPVTFARLLAAFGSAREALLAACRPDGMVALREATRPADGGGPSLSEGVAADVRSAALAPERTLDGVWRAGLTAVTLGDPSYPARLRAVDLPPPVLYVTGDVAAMDRPSAVAIVGTRRPTGQGRLLAGRIAEAVGAAGATVVSGLALGIDAVAHSTVVRLGMPTVAVIGGGHDRLYPAGHRGLSRAIADTGGAVVSEFAPHVPPNRGTFPRRNRIISGLADGTVVVEAGARSGALTTAAWALEQGRSLHIVPGRPDDPSVAGCLAFLRESGPEARIVAGVPELMEDLGLGAGADWRGAPRGPAVLPLGPLGQAIASALLRGVSTVDALVEATGGAPAAVLVTLTGLEMQGLAVEVFGRYRPAGSLAGRSPARSRRPPGDARGGAPGHAAVASVSATVLPSAGLDRPAAPSAAHDEGRVTA